MTRQPDIARVLEDGDFRSVRQVVRTRLEEGVPPEDIAETVIAEAEARIAAGDLNGADAVLFHAVHANIRPSLLFAECRKTYERR